MPIGGRLINNLRYADDTTLLALNVEDVTRLLLNVKEAIESAGLYLNVDKTKMMVVKADTDPVDDTIVVDGEQIERLENFNFLGSSISSDGNCSREIDRRIGMTKSAAGALRKIWCSHNVSLRTKMRLMRSLVFSIFLYGCESWTLKERDKRRINALEMWCWRQMLRISWTEHRTNHYVLQRVGNPPSLLGEVSKRKLRYCGHILRRSDSLEKWIMMGAFHEKRKRGRPRTTWMDGVKRMTSMTVEQVRTCVEDRETWRAVVEQVTAAR